MNLTIDIDKFYVSEFDKMMRQFDASHPRSISQLKEIEKHQKIAHLRDNERDKNSNDKIWSGF